MHAYSEDTDFHYLYSSMTYLDPGMRHQVQRLEIQRTWWEELVRELWSLSIWRMSIPLLQLRLSGKKKNSLELEYW